MKKLVFSLFIVLLLTGCNKDGDDQEVVVYEFDSEFITSVMEHSELDENDVFDLKYFMFDSNTVLFYSSTEAFIYEIDSNTITYIENMEDIHSSYISYIDVENEQYIYSISGITLSSFDNVELNSVEKIFDSSLFVKFFDDYIFTRYAYPNTDEKVYIYDLELNLVNEYEDSMVYVINDYYDVIDVFLVEGTTEQKLYHFNTETDSFEEIGAGLFTDIFRIHYFNEYTIIYDGADEDQTAFLYDGVDVIEFNTHVTSGETLDYLYFFENFVFIKTYDGTTYTMSIYDYNNNLLGEFTSPNSMRMTTHGNWYYIDTENKTYKEFNNDGTLFYEYSFGETEIGYVRSILYGDLHFLILDQVGYLLNGSELQLLDEYSMAYLSGYGYYSLNDEVFIFDNDGNLTEVVDSDMKDIITGEDSLVVSPDKIVHYVYGTYIELSIYNISGEVQFRGSVIAYQLKLENESGTEYGVLILNEEGMVQEIAIYD